MNLIVSLWNLISQSQTDGDGQRYFRSWWIRILHDTVLPGPILCFASFIIAATLFGLPIMLQPIPSFIAHDCGHPQLRSTPLTQGPIISAARPNSIGSFDANWAITGPSVGLVLKSEERATG
jgi:hypothetical protein